MKAPNLRFPEFTDDWSSFKINSVGSFSGGGTPKTKDEHLWQGTIPWVSSSDIKENDITTVNISKFITPEAVKSSATKLIPKDSLLIVSRVGVGKFAIAPADICTSQDFTNIDIDKTKFSVPFIAYNLFVNKNILYDISQGTSIKGFTTVDLKKIILKKPSLNEQKKISDFLQKLDNRISYLKEKKVLLEKYKKGMMRKLFSQELRFKDDIGNDFPEWEEKQLNEIADFRRGSFPQPYGLKKWFDEQNGSPFVQVYDVSDNMKLKNKTKTKISILAQKHSVFVEKGTLVITIQGSIGRIAVTQYDAFVDRTLLIFKQFKQPISIDYFKFALFLLFDYERKIAPGGTIKTITKEALSAFKINIPDLEEQSKIGIFLEKINERIELNKSEIAKAELWKKGLLQQMFV